MASSLSSVYEPVVDWSNSPPEVKHEVCKYLDIFSLLAIAAVSRDQLYLRWDAVVWSKCATYQEALAGSPESLRKILSVLALPKKKTRASKWEPRNKRARFWRYLVGRLLERGCDATRDRVISWCVTERQWEKLKHVNPNIYNTVRFVISDMNRKGVVPGWVIGRSPRLTSLVFSRVGELSDVLLKRFASDVPSLKKLDISYCDNTALSDKGIAVALRHCKDLTHLTLTHNPYVTWQVVPYIGQSLPKLRELVLHGSTFSAFLGHPFIFDQFPALRRLDVQIIY
jgi:hypothetical protein